MAIQDNFIKNAKDQVTSSHSGDYEKSRQDKCIKIQHLLASDFIACGESFEQLSGNYKGYLTDSLSKKHALD